MQFANATPAWVWQALRQAGRASGWASGTGTGTTRMRMTRGDFLKLGLGAAGAGMLPMHRARAAGDQLAILQTEAPRSMDAADHTATYTAAVLAPMYEGLTRFDEALNVVPCLATEWSSDPAGTQWLFKLRPGVQFHDGTRLDADAVAASFRRHLDAKRGLASSGRFRGAIAGVSVHDPMTVAMTLKAPYPALLRLLATNNAGIVSAKAEAAGTLGRHAVGTGPFGFAEWSSGDYVLQRRFDGYWGDKPSFASLKWTWTSEAAVMNMAVRTGDADVVSPLPAAFANTLKTQRGIRVTESDGSAVFWIALNTKLKPFDDVRVRQALNWATDRDGIVRTLFYGHATPADSPLAPVDLFHAPSSPYSFDVAKAKALLAEAGYPDGISVNLAVQEPQANLAEALQGMWAAAGIKLDVQRMEGGVWTQASFGTPEQKAAQTLNATLASWSTGFIDPDLQLRPLYGTANWSPKGPNLGFYSNPTLDQMLDKAGGVSDPEQRRPLYAEAQKLIETDAPHVLLYVSRDLVALRSDVAGVWMVPGGQVMVAGARRG